MIDLEHAVPGIDAIFRQAFLTAIKGRSAKQFFRLIPVWYQWKKSVKKLTKERGLV